MIAKRVPKKTGVADTFTRLGRYVAAAAEEGEKLDRFWLVNCDAGSGFEDLDAALIEIDAVRASKPGVKDATCHGCGLTPSSDLLHSSAGTPTQA